MIKNDCISFLKNLVAIASPYPDESKIGTYLEKILKQSGFSVKRQFVNNQRFNLLAKKGGGQKSILFYGHMDTVSLVNDEKWKTNPFELTERDGKLYGLGASDMKAGITAFIEATKNTNAYVKIFLAVDEENISEGAWKAVQEKMAFFEDVELVISAESSFNTGLNGVTVARTGRCVYMVNFLGKPKHIIKYREAIDALEKLVKFGSDLYRARNKMFASKDTVAQLRKVVGESSGMSVCGEAQAEVEVLLGAEDKKEDVRECLQKLTNDAVVIKQRKTPYLDGYSFKSFPHMELIARIIKVATKKRMELHKRKSVGDDNVLASLGIPVITWGPEGDNEHAPNEYVERKSLITLVNMYKEFLDEIGNGDKK